MHFTEEEGNEIVAKGIEDIFSGTESYAQRYMQGILFANDIVSLGDVNGSESLLQTINTKITQFVKWLWGKIKTVFDWIFGGPQYELKWVKLEGREVISEDSKKFDLKPDAPKKVADIFHGMVQRTKSAAEAYIRNAKEIEKAYKDLDLKNITGDGAGMIEAHFKADIESLEKDIESLRQAPSLYGFGNDCITLMDNFDALRKWFASKYIAHKAMRPGKETTQSQIDEAIKKDIATLEESKQTAASALIMKMSNAAINCAAVLNMNIASCNTVTAGLNSKSYYTLKNKK